MIYIMVKVIIMPQTAKLFMNGRSQAVRLPVELRFEGDEVYIRKDPQTGDVILSRKPGNWNDFFKLVKTSPVPKDFMADRDNKMLEDKDLF